MVVVVQQPHRAAPAPTFATRPATASPTSSGAPKSGAADRRAATLAGAQRTSAGSIARPLSAPPGGRRRPPKMQANNVVVADDYGELAGPPLGTNLKREGYAWFPAKRRWDVDVSDRACMEFLVIGKLCSRTVSGRVSPRPYRVKSMDECNPNPKCVL